MSEAVCQAVRSAARNSNVAELERLLGVGKRSTRGASTASDLESMRHRAMLVAPAADGEGMNAVMHAAGNGNGRECCCFWTTRVPTQQL
jgi:ribosomal protein L2